jgi:hypothetical protein
MAAGSVADIAKWAWPDGFPEEVIATVLKLSKGAFQSDPTRTLFAPAD